MTEIDRQMEEMLNSLQDGIGAIRDDLADVKSRLTSLQRSVISLRRDAAHDARSIVDGRSRLDALADRLARIEDRLIADQIARFEQGLNPKDLPTR